MPGTLLAESDHAAESEDIAMLGISIHALLAESDTVKIVTESVTVPFQSTLSLRRAT